MIHAQDLAGAPVDVDHRNFRVAQDLASPQGLTGDAATFTRDQVIQGLCERLSAGARIAMNSGSENLDWVASGTRVLRDNIFWHATGGTGAIRAPA